MKNRVLIIGAGGHSKVLIDILHLRKIEIIGILDKNAQLVGNSVLGVPIIGGDEIIEKYATDQILLVNAIGSVSLPESRFKIFSHFKQLGFRFSQVIHPSAIIASDVCFGEGAQIMAGTVIQSGSKIGDNAIINTSVSIDHDCTIGPHTHIAPGVIFSGNVTVGEKSHIGVGATVIQGIKIGNKVVVGAGALVLKNIADQSVAVGVPAKKR